MAIFPFKDAVVTVNGVNLSDHVQSCAIETTRDDIDITAMGALYKTYIGGLGDATITVTFFQDFAAAKVDATLRPLSTTDTPFVVTVKPTSAATSTTNPQFSLTSLMFGYSPLSGSVGDASTTDVEFRNASQAGLTVQTV